MNGPGEPRLDYAQVRSRLIERGYLVGPLERFMLGEWSANRTHGRPNLIRSAGKAAMLGAPVLAALVAATVARANPLVVRSDFPLLWLYFTPVCAVGLFVLAALVALLNGFLSARLGLRGSSATRAALLVGVPALVYLLTLSSAPRSADGLIVEGLFLALGLLVVVFVSWLAGLVSVSEMLRRTGRVDGRRGRSLWRVVAFLVPAMLVLTWARIDWDDPAEATAWPEFEVQAAPPLVVVGIDGLGGDWVEALEPTGAVDRTIARLASGALIPIRRQADQEPPAVWMSAMTGVPVAAHGLRHAGMERLPGVVTPIDPAAHVLPLAAALRFLLPSRTIAASGAMRRVRTVWEILGRRRSTLSIGWWGSWPAIGSAAGGSPWVVTDRVLTKLLDGADPDRDTWPAALFPQLADEFEAVRAELRTEFEREFGPTEERRSTLLWESFLIDAYRLRVAWSLSERSGGLDALLVYLPGLDILRRRLGSHPPESELLKRAQALQSYTGWLDAVLERFLVQFGENVTTVLVADPGRTSVAGSEGFLAIHDARAQPGCVEVAPVGLRSVTPIVLALAGFPQSMEMPALGRFDCFKVPLASAPALQSYGRREIVGLFAQSDYDEEMVRRLRSLGYLN